MCRVRVSTQTRHIHPYDDDDADDGVVNDKSQVYSNDNDAADDGEDAVNSLPRRLVLPLTWTRA